MYTVIRYRAKAGDESLEPAQIYGSEQLELAWTITECLAVAKQAELRGELAAA